MTHTFQRSTFALALLSLAAAAQANTTDPKFVDVAGSVSFDGWNELNRNRIGGPLTEAQLVAGTTANVVGSGDAVLTRLSGNHYPAGFGLYGGGSSLSFTDTTVAAHLGSVVFQGLINNFDNPFSLTLSYNGGSQALVAANQGVDNHFYYGWDLSQVGTPITSLTLTLDIGFSQALAFQVDQVAAAVPEPGSYALMLGGLGLMGVIARRRARPA